MTQSTAGSQVVRLPADAFLSLRSAVADGRDAAEAAGLLRDAGFEAGTAFHRALEEWLAAERQTDSADALAPEEFWETLSAFFSHLGWGSLAHERVHAGVGALDATDWLEARGDGGASTPSCHLTTGLLAELLKRVAGAEVAVFEVECRARGDERCRFLFGGQEALTALYQGMVEGTSYAESLARLG